MAATATMLARLRRMTNEPDETNGYTDAVITEIIERYPLLDADGNDPTASDWTAGYDLHAAASEIWEEKASVVAGDFAFSADGGQYSRQQVMQQYMQLAHYHRSRRNLTSGVMVAWPDEPNPALWIGNLPEPD